MKIINGNYREYHLNNGLLVALQETPTETVFGGLRVWHGSLNEKPGEEGLVHYLEHCLIKGGSKNHSPDEAKKILDEFGYSNAITSLTGITFPVDMLGEDTPRYLGLISDIGFNPLFNPQQIEEERQRVIREISDHRSNPSYSDIRNFLKNFYGEGSQHIYEGIGKKEVIENATTEDLKNIYLRGFHPNNANLILVGGLPKNIEELIEKNFGSIKGKGGNRVYLKPNEPLLKSTTIHSHAPELLNTQNPEESNSNLSLCLYAPTRGTKDAAKVALLTDILNEKIHDEVSTKNGFAYSAGASYNAQIDSGLISMGGSIHSKKLEQAIEVIFEEMRKLQTSKISENELQGKKRKVRYALSKKFETNEGHLEAIQEKIDINDSPEEKLDRINAVTVGDIIEAANKYLARSNEVHYAMLIRDPLKNQ